MKNLKLIFSTVALILVTVFAVSTESNAQRIPFDGYCVCPMIYAPVCTFDGKEYSNACLAECDGYTSDEYESCGIFFESASSSQRVLAPWPPYACPDVYDPVCTYDGKKFGNACYAGLAGYTSDQYYSCNAPIN